MKSICSHLTPDSYRDLISLPNSIRITFLLLILGSFSSCAVSYISGYSANKNKIAVNINEHNLGYMIPSDTLATLFNAENLDQFDYNFLSNTFHGINQQGFSKYDSDYLGNVVLKNCLVDFKFIPNFPYQFSGDTLFLNYIQAHLICKNQDTTKGLFYAHAEIPENYQVLVLPEPYHLPKSYQLNNPTQWIINKNTAYLHGGFNKEQLTVLANVLSHNMVSGIDNLAKTDFTIKHPELASKSVAIRDTNTVLTLFCLFIVTAYLLVR